MQGRPGQVARDRHAQPVHPTLQGESAQSQAQKKPRELILSNQQPLLLLALEDYFNNPSVSVLAALYDSLNAIDTTGLPWLSLHERQILRTSDRKDLFEERFPVPSGSGSGSGSASTTNLHGRSPSTQSVATHSGISSTGEHSDLPFRTRSTTSFSSTSHAQEFLRGAQSVESLASHLRDPTHSPSIGTSASASRDDLSLSTSPNLSRAATMNSLEDDAGARPTAHLYRPSGSGADPLPRSPSLTFSQTSPTLASRELGPGGRPKDTHFFETKVVYNGLSLPVKVPLSTFPAEIGDVSLI